MLGVDVQHDRCDLGMTPYEFGNKFLLDGENGIAADEYDHDLSALEAATDEYVPQKSLATVLVVGKNAKRGEHFADGDDDTIGGFIFNLAGIHLHNVV